MPSAAFPTGAVVTVTSARPDAAGEVRAVCRSFPDGGVVAVWSPEAAAAFDRVLSRFRVDLRDSDHDEAYRELLELHQAALAAVGAQDGSDSNVASSSPLADGLGVSVADAASRCRVTSSAIRQAAGRGEIHGRRSGPDGAGPWLLDPESVENYRRKRAR